jgi:hypothetical protein
MAIGSVAMTIHQPSRASASSGPRRGGSDYTHATVTRASSVRKNQMTAARLPSCDGGERRPGVRATGQLGQQPQVSGAGHGHELGEALHRPEQQGLEQRQAAMRDWGAKLDICVREDYGRGRP